MVSNDVVLKSYYDIPIHCPFCGRPHSAVTESGALEVAGCNHLMIFTCSEGIIVAHERLRNAALENGYKLSNEDELFYEISTENEEDGFYEEDIIEIAKSFEDAVSFVQVVGPPSGERSFIVFAFNDEDYAAYGEQLSDR